MNDFSRSAALLGESAMARLGKARVLVVGVGGVGGWCAEALVRTGVGRVTVMDDDTVAPSNLNRQCPATVANVGRVKVDAMRERLLSVNPEAEVTAVCRRYPAEGDAGFLSGFDLVIDAIDSVDCKARLILDAFAAGVPVVSSMGAALRRDPCAVKVSRFEKVEGDGLAKALRNRFRKLGCFPGRFSCVWSSETPVSAVGGVKGSLMQVTAVFGMALAAQAVNILLPDGTAHGHGRR